MTLDFPLSAASTFFSCKVAQQALKVVALLSAGPHPGPTSGPLNLYDTTNCSATNICGEMSAGSLRSAALAPVVRSRHGWGFTALEVKGQGCTEVTLGIKGGDAVEVAVAVAVAALAALAALAATVLQTRLIISTRTAMVNIRIFYRV